MADFRERIAEAVAGALEGKLKKEEIAALLEKPPTADMGDLALPCFKLAAKLKSKPEKIVLDIAEKMMLPEGIEGINPQGPYLNFFYAKDLVASRAIVAVLNEGKAYGLGNLGKGKKAMVEYSGPNANKPLHLGHLRNNAIGMAVSNIVEANGFKVVRANIVNDRGIHISKSMLAYKLYGKGSTPEKEGKKPDHFVGNFYVMFNKEAQAKPELEKQAYGLLQKWESKDRETIGLWKKMTDWAVKGFKETYKNFGSMFDEWFFESQFYDKARPILDLGKSKGIFRENKEGALVAELEEQGLANKTVLRADGTSIYITNDLALTKHKFERFKLNKSIWVVGSEQDLYFRQLFKIFELLGFPWANACRHLSHGMVYLPSGKLKSREGKVIDADDIIAEMKRLSSEEIMKRDKNVSATDLEKRSQAISLAAIKFHMLKIAVQKDLLFKPEESISFEGETGPYVQYTYARAKSILAKAGNPQTRKFGFERLLGPEEQKILKLIASYPSMVEKAGEDLSPHIICHFLIELSEAFNSFYHKHQVIKAGTDEIKMERIALVKATAQVLENGLRLLDIEPIEKM